MLLIASGASEPTTHYADISPSGPTVTGTKAGDEESPIQWDSVNLSLIHI